MVLWRSRLLCPILCSINFGFIYVSDLKHSVFVRQTFRSPANIIQQIKKKTHFQRMFSATWFLLTVPSNHAGNKPQFNCAISLPTAFFFHWRLILLQVVIVRRVIENCRVAKNARFALRVRNWTWTHPPDARAPPPRRRGWAAPRPPRAGACINACPRNTLPNVTSNKSKMAAASRLYSLPKSARNRSAIEAAAAAPSLLTPPKRCWACVNH